jgi:hypothetical protein
MIFRSAMIYVVLLISCLVPSHGQAFCFNEAGAANGISPVLLQAIAKVESGLNPKAVNINSNGSRDLGLMQINSSWIKAMKLDGARLFSDPCYNTTVGARILRDCIDRKGYTWAAVGCYNAVSTPKQVAYSWKIYRLMQKTASFPPESLQSIVQSTTTPGGDELLAANIPEATPSYLTFSVRDTMQKELETP